MICSLVAPLEEALQEGKQKTGPKDERSMITTKWDLQIGQNVFDNYARKQLF